MDVFVKALGETEAFVAIPLLHRPPLLRFSIVSFICDNTLHSGGFLAQAKPNMEGSFRESCRTMSTYGYLDKALG